MTTQQSVLIADSSKLDSLNSDEKRQGGVDSADTSTAAVSSSSSPMSTDLLFPLPPPPPAPPLPPNGLFASNTNKIADLADKLLQRSGNGVVGSTSSTGVVAPRVKSSRIQTLTAQLNLAECLSAGGHRGLASPRPRVMSAGTTGDQTDSAVARSSRSTINNNNNTSPPLVQRANSGSGGVSPYRYGHHTSNFATRSTSANTVVLAAETTTAAKGGDSNACKRNIAIQTGRFFNTISPYKHCLNPRISLFESLKR